MSQFNLDDLTDKDIVRALFELPASKFLSVINALGVMSKALEKRGKEIATDSDDVVERMIKSLFEEE